MSSVQGEYIWILVENEVVKVWEPIQKPQDSVSGTDSFSFGSDFNVTPPDENWEWKEKSETRSSVLDPTENWSSDESYVKYRFTRKLKFPQLPALVNQLRGTKLPTCHGRLRDRFPVGENVPEIVVVDVEENYVREQKVFPTEWIQISNPYWDAVRAAAKKIHCSDFWSWIPSKDDDVFVAFKRQKNGDLYAMRCGVTVVIEHGNGGNGNIPQRTPLVSTSHGNPHRGKKEMGVPTAYINPTGPYWRRLLFNMLQPLEGITTRIASDVDGVKCVIMCEADGSVAVSRMYQKVQLLGPLEPGEIQDVSIPWGGEE